MKQKKRYKIVDSKQIEEARNLLNLWEYSTLEDIKKSYRSLSLKYHPDKCDDENKEECEKMFKRISLANKLIQAYCKGYRYSFKEEDVKRNLMYWDYDEYMERFYADWNKENLSP
ncbi:MAG: DnaJ domain-containing protein [Candidatus Theseobacter exili]|nr:DnaJ domain-containing protein [Candidatus Theseobacter exili]